MIEFSIDISNELKDGSIKAETRNAAFLNNPFEITLKRWASYFERLEEMPEWFKDFHNAKDEAGRQKLQKEWTAQQWAESYVIFAKLGLTFVNGASFDDLLEMPLGDNGGDGIDSLLTLFAATIHGVYGYEPQPREYFEWKGRKFKAFVSQKVAGQDMPGADMTVRDAINALQLEHSWQQHTTGGAHHYNINVGVLAALSREIVDGKVEKPPVDGLAYMRWFEERQRLFADITMDIALDVVFFSTHLRALSPNIPLSLSSLLQASPAG